MAQDGDCVPEAMEFCIQIVFHVSPPGGCHRGDNRFCQVVPRLRRVKHEVLDRQQVEPHCLFRRNRSSHRDRSSLACHTPRARAPARSRARRFLFCRFPFRSCNSSRCPRCSRSLPFLLGHLRVRPHWPSQRRLCSRRDRLRLFHRSRFACDPTRSPGRRVLSRHFLVRSYYSSLSHRCSCSQSLPVPLFILPSLTPQNKTTCGAAVCCATPPIRRKAMKLFSKRKHMKIILSIGVRFPGASSKSLLHLSQVSPTPSSSPPVIIRCPPHSRHCRGPERNIMVSILSFGFLASLSTHRTRRSFETCAAGFSGVFSRCVITLQSQVTNKRVSLT